MPESFFPPLASSSPATLPPWICALASRASFFISRRWWPSSAPCGASRSLGEPAPPSSSPTRHRRRAVAVVALAAAALAERTGTTAVRHGVGLGDAGVHSAHRVPRARQHRDRRGGRQPAERAGGRGLHCNYIAFTVELS